MSLFAIVGKLKEPLEELQSNHPGKGHTLFFLLCILNNNLLFEITTVHPGAGGAAGAGSFLLIKFLHQLSF